MNRQLCLLLPLGLVMVGSLALPSTAPAQTSTKKSAPSSDSYFALNGTKFFHIPEEIGGKVKQRFGWMKELDVSWDRIDLWWHQVEPSRGTFDFSRADLCFNEYERQGVQWYPILCYGASWFEKGRSAPKSDQDFADYARFVSRTVGRYKGRAPYWSLWNEPNISIFWAPEPDADAYTRLMKVAYKAFKKADPKAKLCAPVIAPLGSWDRKFVERMYQLGGKNHFDVFDYHYYRHGAPEIEVPNEIAEIKAVMSRYGDGNKPMWISEAGVTQIVDGKPGSQSRHAALVVRNQLLCIALGIEKFFYFDLQNWYDDQPQTWDTQLGLVTAGGQKKKAFYAYKTMVDQVDHQPFIGRVQNLGSGLQGVLVYGKAKKEYVLSAWCTVEHGSKALAVDLLRKQGTFVGPYGETKRVTATPRSGRNVVNLTIGENPVYVRGVDPARYLPEAGLKLDPAMIILSPGDKGKLLPVLSSYLKGATARVVSAEVPTGLKWDRTTGSLTCLSTATPGVVTINARIQVVAQIGGKKQTSVFDRNAKVEITPTLTVALRPFMDGQNLRLQASVANLTSVNRSNVLRLLDSPRAPQILDKAVVKPNVTWRSDYPATNTLLDACTGVNQWQLSFGSHRSKPFKVYAARFSAQGPAVDGDLSDWKGVPSVSINNASQITRNPSGWTPANASAECRAWFTPEALFVAADVRDNSPMINSEQPPMLWKGDSVEIYLGTQGPTKRTVIDKAFEYQIGIAPIGIAGQPLAFWFHKDVLLNRATVAARRTSNGYILEAMIPWAELGVDKALVKEGAVFGFDVKLNDLDRQDVAPMGNLPGRDLVWNGTGANWIDPSGWGMAILRTAK